MKLTIELKSTIDSHELKRLINHLASLEGFEFVSDPNYDCKIVVKSVRKYKNFNEDLQNKKEVV